MKISSSLKTLTLALFLGLAACMPAPTPLLSAPWEYNQLRALDAPDAPQSTLDLVAAYARDAGDEIQIRLDLLDHASLPDYDLYLALDTREGGTTSLPLRKTADLAWDALLTIPAKGSVQILDAGLQPGMGNGLLILRDPIQDTVTISIKNDSLNDITKRLVTNRGMRFQVFLTPSGSDLPVDALGPVNINATAPVPAPVLFAFWSSYPAYTPLTALRRWAGAHTGPGGGSHGLQYLLQASRATQTPLVLLDLKNPAWLSALDYGDNLDTVKEMLEAGLLILPEYTLDDSYAPFPPDAQTVKTIKETNLSANARFGLPTSPFVYAPAGSFYASAGRRFTFTLAHSVHEDVSTLEPTYVEHLRDQRFLVIPDHGSQTPQATLDGPSLEVKRSLVQTALMANRDPSDAPFALVLGGELPASTWGEPLSARRTLEYLARHPWVHPIDAYNLLTARSRQGILASSPDVSDLSAQADNALLAALQNAPTNSLRAAAWQAFAALSAPVFPAPKDLPTLRENYTSNVWSLIEAANWAEKPARVVDCTQDPDHDGLAECILASDTYYAQFEVQTGALTHAFAILPGEADGENMHQWIAPSSQFISGLSDPLYWNLNAGPAADPSVIFGAFDEPGMDYQVNTAGDCLIFTASSNDTRKTFCLYAGGLEVEYRFAKQPPFSSLQIPLALDPWRRFTSDWAQAYQGYRLVNGWNWELNSGPRVRIFTDANLRLESFLDSRGFFDRPEDPNLDYPPGHTLPFPLALVKIPVQGNLNLQLKIDQTIPDHLPTR
jgi:hypothetical protein